MPEVEAPVVTPASAQPASETPAPTSADSKTDDKVSMSKAEFEAFIKLQTKPWEEKFSNAEADLGRLKRHTSYDKETVERLTNAEKNFELVKSLIVGLGIPQDDIKDAESVRDLAMLLRGRKPVASPANGGGQAKGEPSSDLFTQFQEFLASRQNGNGAPANKGSDTFVKGGAAGSVTVTADNIDKLYNEGKVSQAAYNKFRNGGSYDGPLPS